MCFNKLSYSTFETAKGGFIQRSITKCYAWCSMSTCQQRDVAWPSANVIRHCKVPREKPNACNLLIKDITHSYCSNGFVMLYIRHRLTVLLDRFFTTFGLALFNHRLSDDKIWSRIDQSNLLSTALSTAEHVLEYCLQNWTERSALYNPTLLLDTFTETVSRLSSTKW